MCKYLDLVKFVQLKFKVKNVENAKIDEQRPFLFAENDQKRNFEGGGELNLIISTHGTMASTPPRLVGTIYEHFAMLQ